MLRDTLDPIIIQFDRLLQGAAAMVPIRLVGPVAPRKLRRHRAAGTTAAHRWDTAHPPQNSARQIARYSRQIAAGHKTAANWVVR